MFGSSDRALVTVAGLELALFRNGDEIHAFANACPHQGNPLIDGEIRSETLRCTYHLWEFDLRTGACISGEKPAQTYAAQIEGDEVLIAVPE